MGNFSIPQPIGQQSQQQNRNIMYEYDQTHPRDSYLRRLRSIPVFTGKSQAELREFMDVAESLNFSWINASERNEFYEQMFLQLRGEARNVVNDLSEPDWDTIKQALLTHFAYLNNRDIITNQLENIHQEKTESLSKFAERTRKLLQEKNNSYSHLTDEQRSEHNRIARKAFSRGVTNSILRERLLTRGANSLEDAIAFAIETENDSTNNISNNELFCGLCRLSGHRYRDCRRNSQNSGIGQSITALRTIDVDRSAANFFSRGGFPNNRGGFPNNRGNFNRFNRGNFNNFNRNNNWNNFNQNNNFNRSNNFNRGNWNGFNPNRGNYNPNFGQNNSNFDQNSARNNAPDGKNRNFPQNSRRQNDRAEQNMALPLPNQQPNTGSAPGNTQQNNNQPEN